VGFEADPQPGSHVQYYAVPQFESAGGRALALAIAGECAARVEAFTPAVSGMRLAILRETRMPAVLITIGQVQHALDHAGELVEGLVAALEAWAGQTLA
jgi:N-acetylmuramoyl-L-alanine amidase